MFSKQAYILAGMKSLHERVKHAINQSGNTPSSAAKVLGCSPEAVLQWMSGATKNLRPPNLFSLADLTGFSARWIATGEGPQIEAYKNKAIQHVVQVMENMPPDEQQKLARMADAFVVPSANDDPPAAPRKRRVDS